MQHNAGKVTIVPKGEFVLGTQYERLNLVTYDDAAYIAIKDNIDVLPTDEKYWMFVLSSKWGGYSISVLPESGYQELEQKDEKTIYFRFKDSTE